MYCCVPLCDTSSRFNSVVSFHTFPLDKETSKKWIHYIRREDFNITPNTRVCSRHFKSDDLIEPSTPTGRRLLKKGAVPTLFEWNKYSTSAPRRTGAWQRREVSPPLNEDPVPVDLQHEEHDYCSFPVPAAVDLSLDQTEDLRKEVEQLRKQVEELSVRHRFCLGRFAASDDDIRFYTRFVTYNHLMAFWRLIEPASHNMVRVTRARAATTRSYSPSCNTGLPTQNLHGPNGAKAALGWPTLGHHGNNVGSPLVRAAHREPTKNGPLLKMEVVARTSLPPLIPGRRRLRLVPPRWAKFRPVRLPSPHRSR
ncbi:uncharacterized protein LOC131533086 [Onychostoma macrolepis]|uniref:uncharacterized protein LOC131533086 n=1 Tax=Onychostoma macrolepis TaxID=369639 RepID=UPI00272B7744|nr:uncharacterized protein LOC131533086 [Onychostoma macrolepis]